MSKSLRRQEGEGEEMEVEVEVVEVREVEVAETVGKGMVAGGIERDGDEDEEADEEGDEEEEDNIGVKGVEVDGIGRGAVTEMEGVDRMEAMEDEGAVDGRRAEEMEAEAIRAVREVVTVVLEREVEVDRVAVLTST